MAEIISNKNRKSTPRIDLTPMVDLGFLLITFFVMTSSLSKPKTLDLQMPAEGGTSTEIPHHTAMTIFLGSQHQLYYLTGIDAMNNAFEKMTQTTFRANGIRKALLDHEAHVRKAFAEGLKGSTNHDRPFILIKAGETSQYSDLVDLLDELAIVNISDYALLDMDPVEEKAIAFR